MNTQPSNPSRRMALRAGALGTAALALSGCIVVPRRGYQPDRGAGPVYGGGAVDPGGVYVEVPPPEPVHEVIGVAPFLGALWISGYWAFGGGRYRWSPGYWSAPRPGYHWQPHRWVPSGRGWRQQGGRWGR